jgi:hypothetical protein
VLEITEAGRVKYEARGHKATKKAWLTRPMNPPKRKTFAADAIIQVSPDYDPDYDPQWDEIIKAERERLSVKNKKSSSKPSRRRKSKRRSGR